MYSILETLCNERGTTITKLCTQITGSSGNLSTWKKGYMRSDYLVKIADYFNVSVDYLLGRTEHASNNITNSGTNNGTQANIINNEKSDYNINEQKLIEKFRELDYDEQIGVLADVIGKTKE